MSACGRRVVEGSPRADVVQLAGRHDRAVAGSGDDTVDGGPWGDVIEGGPGADVLSGGAGPDTISGGRGHDTVRGDDGDDQVSGDRGDDLVVGGGGADRFVLIPDGGRDVAADFDGAAGDRIVLYTGRTFTVRPDPAGALLRLDDSSTLRLTGVPAPRVGKWIVRVRPPAQPGLPWRTGLPGIWDDPAVLGAGVVAVLAGLGMSAAALVSFRRAPGGRRGTPDPHQEAGVHRDALAEQLPHAQTRSVGLDAMRAAAILLVLASHWWVGMAPWGGLPAPTEVARLGELGVVLFFALSGFLIGRILIVEADADPGWGNFGVFMVRRWLRTLPLYFVVLAVLLTFRPPPDRLAYGLQYATLTQNLFGPMPPGGFFAVTWSLTVEEWFYVLFGASVFLAFRRRRAPQAFWGPVALFVLAPLMLRLWAPTAPEVLLRLDQIAYGCIAAQLHRSRAAIFDRPRTCLVAGAALIVLFLATEPMLPPAAAPVLSSVGCCLLIPAALRMRVDREWLARGFGSLSAMAYPLYLIHLDLLVTVAISMKDPGLAPAWVCLLVATVTPFLLAYASFRFLEAPILRLRPAQAAAGRRNADQTGEAPTRSRQSPGS